MLARAYEKFSPHFVALMVLALSYWRAPSFFATAIDNHWHTDVLYASVFNIAAAASAFLFAFFAYVKTAEGQVLRELRGTGLFRRASRYMVGAIVWSAVLALLTVPFAVAVPEPSHRDTTFWVVILWAALTAYVFAAIARSAYHFIAIMEAAYGDRLRG